MFRPTGRAFGKTAGNTPTRRCGSRWRCIRAGRREEAATLAEDMALSLTAPEYGAEPFVLPADIAYAPGKEGRAGWSWYTGAAGWYLRLLRELYGAEP